MNKITVSMNLEFAGVVLPVAQDENGRDVVPLKPIAEVFGLKWDVQRVRVSRPEMVRRMGTCTPVIRGADQAREMVCIRLDRVAAWLNTLNPERVRAAGNADGADFLEAKQTEWDDLLHAYELERGGVFATQAARSAAARERQMRLLYTGLKLKNATGDARDRQVLTKLCEQTAAELGVPYQPELTAGEE
ncbi:MAG TPA: phage antirepressor N-terminal domain-containing protein [Rhodocyclaceae bacterium]|uniref:phage antirepressor N-terminal domain-containing protein n=1 Tax=Plasticicumulans sp. TaxID=2307179 RepID=UPI002BE3436A|nr:phage antirepressor N-terminal domain-containing protein [Rhodocyclaceae bacterium]